MNPILRFCCLVLLGSCVVNPVRAELEVSASFRVRSAAEFEAPLATYGSWVELSSHEHCWRPARVAVNWRPYCDGDWVWTDCGWYWESEEPWSWACYHYGYWVYDSFYGWVWVPGVEWAPAWVSWRVGEGYVGWAPLPPPGFRASLGGPQFVFVETTRFLEPIRPKTVIINNTTILNHTTVINNVTRETTNIGGAAPQRVVINNGPGLAAVQRATRKTLQPVPIREAARRAAPPAGFSPRPSDMMTAGRRPESAAEHQRSHPDHSEPSPHFGSYRDPWTPAEGRAPEQPSAWPALRGKSDRAPEAHGGGGDQDRHGEGHGKDKP